jgi:hypothetical protein
MKTLGTIVLFLFVGGCSALERPTDLECTVLFEHYGALQALRLGEEIGGDSAGGRAIASIAAATIGDKLFDSVGLKDKFIRRCQVSLRRYQVEACLECQSLEQFQERCE